MPDPPIDNAPSLEEVVNECVALRARAEKAERERDYYKALYEDSVKTLQRVSEVVMGGMPGLCKVCFKDLELDGRCLECEGSAQEIYDKLEFKREEAKNA